MASLFLSYRRDDSAGFAGRLSEALEAAFGADSVFRDVDDIHPGSDFAAAIQQELYTVGAVLVLIGPDWLAAEAEGRRRLEDPADFVRIEVFAALASGKPVIPVLVNGAAMPRERDLPEPLRPLARRQAFSLADAAWKSDVARLTRALRPLLPRRSLLPFQFGRPRWALLLMLAGAGLAVLALVVPLPVWLWPPAPDIAGRWTARVKYDWGAEHEEVFEFKPQDGQIRGSAGFLGLARDIEAGRLAGRRLSFLTRGGEVLGDAPAREVTRRYEGEVDGGMRANAIRFTLATSGGYSQHTPVQFVARRAPGDARAPDGHDGKQLAGASPRPGRGTY